LALHELDKIDAIGIEKLTGDVVLTITDAWDWTDEAEHLELLQHKILHYLRFLDEGQLAEAYPESIGRQVVIEIVPALAQPAGVNQLLLMLSRVARGTTIRSSEPI